jgi:transglutaminase-like putative cysteine protease
VKSRAVFAAPLLVALALHAWASGAYPQDAFVCVLAVLGVAIGGRVPVAQLARRVLGVVFFLVGAGIGWSRVPELGYGPGTLPRAASLLAVGSILCGVAGLYASDASKTRARERTTFVLGTLAVAASGATRLGLGYALFASAYVAVALLALRARDSGRARRADLAFRHRATLAGAVVVAGGLAVAFVRVVPKLHDAVEDAIERRFTMHDMVGFGAGSHLGEMREMIQSEVEVLRISQPRASPPVDYIRGAVYDYYQTDGFWSDTPFAEHLHEVAVGTELAPRETAVRVRRVAGTPGRYFLPLAARDVRVVSGRIVVDEVGSALTATSDHATEYSFVMGTREKLAAARPRATDLLVPRAERQILAGLAREWTSGAAADEDKLEAIRAHLDGGYRYSLTFDRARDASDDPLLDFLLRDKLGYCTYFATAMTMLARSSGVPARLVTGYRVAEWSPVAREYVVREKNAHAWVEAWVGGEWRTFDPTPMQELPQDRQHLASLGTLAADSALWIEQAVAYAIAHVTPAQLFALLGALGAMWAGVRWLRARGASGARVRSEAGLDQPLPFFATLATSLERRGILRDPSEPLEHFARRVAELGLSDAAQLVGRYAALRYGGVGDASRLERDVAAFVRHISP